MRDQTLPLEPGRRRLDALAAQAGPEAIAALRAAAAPLQGLRVVHVTAPPFTTAAVDHLTSVVPLLRDLGLDAHWRAIAGDPDAHAAGRVLNDGLRGGELALTDEQAGAWRAQHVAPVGADVIVLHEAAALGAVATRAKGDGARWAWRLHGDGSSPAAGVWDLLQPLAAQLTTVVAHTALAPPALKDATAIAPAVDPLSARHLALPPKVTGDFARAAGIDLSIPAIASIATLDAWAEPEDAIDIWERSGVPQLVLVARVAHGDERAWRALGELHAYAGARDGLVVVADIAGHGDGAANAAQRLARAVLQLDGDGYGIAASEAISKGTPAVSADTPAFRDQGADIPADPAARLAELAADPGLAVEIARAGHQHTRDVTRLIADELRWLASIT